MKNQYEINLQTSKSLDADSFGRPFLAAWLEEARWRPEKFGHGEPVRNPIEDGGIDALIAEWKKPPALMFRRVSAPKFVASLQWREKKGKDPRNYPWGVTVWLDLKAGDEFAINFFRFLIRWFEPAFGSLRTVQDSREKHFVKYPYYKGGKLIGTAECNVGRDVGDKLPGIYWCTYITSDLLDERLLAQLGDAILCRDHRGGYLIRAYERSSDIGSEAARSLEREIANTLGPDRFFDVGCWTPPDGDTRYPGPRRRH